MRDLIVIGAGVAGLMAAGTAAAEGHDVLLLEKMEKPARKLRITGKGRCNLTNIRPMDEFLQKIPQGAEFVRPSLERFDNQAVVRFVESIGVSLTTERGGRVFPTSGRAWDIAEAMVVWAKRQGVEIRCNSQVQSISRTGDVFTVELSQNNPFGGRDVKNKAKNISNTQSAEAHNGCSLKIECSNLLIATGGVSYPATGSTGDGYQFAYDLGHSIVPLRPSLVPLDIGRVDNYKGLALKNVGLKLVVNGAVAAERFGDVEFTDRALGGATVLQISRQAVDAIIEKKRVEVELDLKPALSETKLRNRIDREIEAMPTATNKVLLQKLIPSPLFPIVAEQSGIKLSQPIARITDDEKSRIIIALKSLKIEVLDYRPFTEAIITAGGIALSEVDPLTMRSKIVPNLYLAGEVLDIDADTGGFNIQIAMSTAYVAAKSITRS